MDSPLRSLRHCRVHTREKGAARYLGPALSWRRRYCDAVADGGQLNFRLRRKTLIAEALRGSFTRAQQSKFSLTAGLVRSDQEIVARRVIVRDWGGMRTGTVGGRGIPRSRTQSIATGNHPRFPGMTNHERNSAACPLQRQETYVRIPASKGPPRSMQEQVSGVL